MTLEESKEVIPMMEAMITQIEGQQNIMAEMLQEIQEKDEKLMCFQEQEERLQQLEKELSELLQILPDTEELLMLLDVPFPVSWTVKMKKKQKETQDILSYHSQAAGCSDKARAKASGGRQPIEECGRTGL